MIRLSIVIATYNRAPILARSLRSLREQTLEHRLWEIVVVDNNSTDDTQAVAAGFAAENPIINLRIVAEPQQGLSYARNCGIAAAAGDLIVMIDDDIEADGNFARAYLDFFDEHPDVAAAGGRIVPLYDTPPPHWLSKYTEQPISGTTYLGSSVAPCPRGRTPNGGNMGFRRAAVERHGGFDTMLGRKGSAPLAGEEREFFRRMRLGGEKIYYIPGALIHHVVPASRFTDEYFDRVTRGVGVSEHIRTRSLSSWAYFVRTAVETVKWGATLLLAAGFALRGEAIKGRYLIRLRCNISKGLTGCGQ
ncbi:MAG: glycosyltransferase family 2 protein [Rikenellaceae bacterium]|jgi:glycosyltransferase involved in cell wall biosynthesis|nr:glycosyltransferase family 2 protein [Rikenellaceae bacterium]